MESSNFSDLNGLTMHLAQFASKLNYHELPPEVIEQTKTCILDALGCVFLGSTMQWGKIIGDYVKALGSKAESIIIGTGAKAAAGSAALANGTMGHGFEFDDVYIPAIHHPGVVVVPAALAVAEREGSSGREFITAVAAGYEVMNRVGESVTESHLMRGFFPTGTNGTFGAAASAGNLLHLNGQQMTDALGIAGSQSAGLAEGIKEGRMTKRFGAGRAAQDGIMAADLAKLGFTGPTKVLEGEWGYHKAYSDKVDPSRLTQNLGEKYNIMETTFKPYPCCKALHATIDGLLELSSEHHFEPDHVTEVVVGGYEKLVKMHNIYAPATSMAAQFSIPYVVSLTLLKGTPGIEDFEERSLGDKRILEFAQRVRTVVDSEILPYFPDNEPAKVTIKLKNGSSYARTIISSKGTPQNPMTGSELETKFKTLASRVIPEAQADEAVETIRTIDTLTNVGELSAILSKGV